MRLLVTCCTRAVFVPVLSWPACALAQQVETVEVTLDSVVGWDHSGTDLEGKPARIEEAELALFRQPSDPDSGFLPLESIFIPATGAGEALLRNLFLFRPPGDYSVSCRVRDQNNRWSAWSEPLSVFFAGVDALFIRGDSNSDGQVDVSDVIHTWLFMHAGGRRPSCYDAADADDSSAIDIADVLYTLQAIFLDGPPLPAPGPVCTIDETPDNLGCKEFVPCL